MNKRKIIIISIVILLIVLLALIYPRILCNRYTKNLERISIHSVSIDSYSDYPSVNNITDETVINLVADLLQEVKYQGLIFENEIYRAAEKQYCRLNISFKDESSCEIQLTEDEYNQCYLRFAKGIFSSNVYLHLINCEELYNYIESIVSQ